MTILDAWNSCEHGKSIINSKGTIVEKWIGDKPDMKPSFNRWMEENASSLPVSELFAGDWNANT